MRTKKTKTSKIVVSPETAEQAMRVQISRDELWSRNDVDPRTLDRLRNLAVIKALLEHGQAEVASSSPAKRRRLPS